MLREHKVLRWQVPRMVITVAVAVMPAVAVAVAVMTVVMTAAAVMAMGQ